MPYTIGKTYQFEAAHQLRSLPMSHKCSSMHGHTYRVDVEISGEIDANGMVMDYAGLDMVVACFLKVVDHKVLNHLPGLEQDPTAEVIAMWFAKMLHDALARVVTIRVWENPTSWAEVTV